MRGMLLIAAFAALLFPAAAQEDAEEAIFQACRAKVLVAIADGVLYEIDTKNGLTFIVKDAWMDMPYDLKVNLLETLHCWLSGGTGKRFSPTIFRDYKTNQIIGRYDAWGGLVVEPNR